MKYNKANTTQQIPCTVKGYGLRKDGLRQFLIVVSLATFFIWGRYQIKSTTVLVFKQNIA
ncbi:hypothetical protein MAR_023841 [Mya arenaria]|uniref:Uncharacterized protein n=1 Tax=Mya arenaria TaxID=6604 RepID=A0ABY7DQS8_MYAAR|nr:hypothetical protein MAR_023841 [Mya arenaria]